jgi:hypothetical protein
MRKEYKPYMYMICYPNEALVLSQLSPEDFTYRYSYGSATYYSGKLIFAELDIDYRNDYFEIADGLSRLKSHSDGSPKATLFIKTYRILEHVEPEAIKVLYLANADGHCYPLYPGPFEPKPDVSDLRAYAEITPLSVLTLSKLDMRAFGAYFTNPETVISVPRLMYMQINLDVDYFLEEFEMNPFMPPPLEGVHPSKLRNAINNLRARETKFLKSLTLDMSMTKESFRKIRQGIMIKDAKKEVFFPMPSLEEIEEKDFKFWKGM